MKRYNAQPLDLMQFINTKYHEPFIHAQIDLEKRPDENRLLDALNTLIEVFPILKCRYDSQENVFIEQENASGKNLLKIKDNADRTAVLTESSDMNKRLILFTLSGNSLYITVSHLVCDGSAFKQLIYLFCDIYNGYSGSRGEYLMDRAFSQLSKYTGSRSETVKMLASMLGNYKNRPIYTKSSEEQPYIVEQTVQAAVMSKVHEKAKKQGATLNDVFLAAYARALGRLYGLTKINIPCTVDLRKYAQNKTGIANLTGTYNLNIKMDTAEPFHDTLSVVSKTMQRQKNTNHDIAGPALLVSKYEKLPLEKFLRVYGGMNTSAYSDYTNLGVFDSDRLYFKDNKVINAVGYSGLSKAPFFQLAISSFHGNTTVSSLFQSSEAEKDKANKLIDAVVFEIQSFGVDE